jgi:hypothetical protein
MALIPVGVAVSIIFASAAATSSANPPDKNPAAKPANSDPAAVKYCVETAPFTGSMISKTECKTRAEWAKKGVDVDQLVKH